MGNRASYSVINTIEKFVRPEIRDLKAYHVGEAKNLIKLDNMENPYSWDQSVMSEWVELLKGAPVNRYPDPEALSLQKALREAMSIPDDAGLILGNGSDELIQMICMALSVSQDKKNATILSLGPTFVMYKMLALFTNMEYNNVDLNEDFSLNVDAMLAAIEKTQPAVVFISYPNNPTGNLFDEQEVCQIIEASPGLVVIDEAYFAFAGDSFAKYLDRYENMMIMRTVSKMGLAGLRLGYMMGNPRWIEEFNKVRLPFNINCLTQISVEFALKNRAMFDEQTDRLCVDREGLYAEMQKIDGIVCYPSKANFILFKPTKAGSANVLFESIKQAGILIRNLSANGGLLTDCLRVTIGADFENAAFLKALQEIFVLEQSEQEKGNV